DFARAGKMRQVTLHVELALLAIGWGRKSNYAEYTGADTLRDRLDRAAFARSIAAFKHKDDAQSLVFHPVLELTQLDLEFTELPFIFLVPHLCGAVGGGVLSLLHGLSVCTQFKERLILTLCLSWPGRSKAEAYDTVDQHVAAVAQAIPVPHRVQNEQGS